MGKEHLLIPKYKIKIQYQNNKKLNDIKNQFKKEKDR